jgi:DNA-binding phage protein
MPLTRDFRETVVARVRRDPAFARALLDEAATLFLNGEPVAARLVLRDLVNATVGFEALARKTSRPSKSLQRMLSKSGNPSMDNLAAIISALRGALGVDLTARAIRAVTELRQKGPLSLIGKLEWDESYNYKSERSR